MKKLLKSGIYGSVNSARIYCSPWKSQQMRVEKKKKNVENVNAVSAKSKLHLSLKYS